ncbi:hypothetical protein ARGLB_064_01020 [Arthrobacter globiformis NBRC 12137]|uniref:Glycosyltransferase n=1 Tax=Arthrobacter globiformis (strain ATCC 8010 / DSM 20124 / JCM 1332 / NBRC 12137 / NCIMB 8907 / NRRL B-2979 / 168) TaxID=1077972 RepID=H0QND9_ARTG1|nr:hypothetical protein ARGLB_064_01020 [Arthrobacter globiformis NBRC 12137]
MQSAARMPSVSRPLGTPNVLLAEPRFSGHRLAYVRVLAEEALRRDQLVHVALPSDAVDSAEFRVHLSDLLGRVSFIEIANFGLNALEETSKRVNASRTVVTDGDGLALELAKRGSWRGAGRLSVLIMRESVQHPGPRILRWLKNGAKKAIVGRAAFLPGVDLAVLKSATWSGKSALRVAVDPVQLSCSSADVEAIRMDWGLDSSKYWFAVLGAITPRKNVPLLADSISRISRMNVGLVIAGKIEPSIRQEVDAAVQEAEGAGVNVVVVDRTLSDRELDAAVTVADCLLLAHSNEGPSGLLGKAACAGTRVLAAGARSLRVDTEGLAGLAEWVELEADAIADAMNHARASNGSGARIATGSDSFLKALLPVG